MIFNVYIKSKINRGVQTTMSSFRVNIKTDERTGQEMYTVKHWPELTLRTVYATIKNDPGYVLKFDNNGITKICETASKRKKYTASFDPERESFEESDYDSDEDVKTCYGFLNCLYEDDFVLDGCSADECTKEDYYAIDCGDSCQDYTSEDYTSDNYADDGCF